MKDVRTDRRTEVQTPHAKIVISTCCDCGSAEWINKVVDPSRSLDFLCVMQGLSYLNEFIAMP